MTSEIVINGHFIAITAVVGAIVIGLMSGWMVLLRKWYKGDFD